MKSQPPADDARQHAQARRAVRRPKRESPGGLGRGFELRCVWSVARPKSHRGVVTSTKWSVQGYPTLNPGSGHHTSAAARPGFIARVASPDWIKAKNPAAPAATRIIE